MKVEMGFFKCMESMARDMRHPYVPSTIVLGDTRGEQCKFFAVPRYGHVMFKARARVAA